MENNHTDIGFFFFKEKRGYKRFKKIIHKYATHLQE